ncbi:MAG: hypothetical protein E7661_09580 [Ruminococcaceae bacterium]|nr:hypothetical protein [Oscillospiraceae bacterium]
MKKYVLFLLICLAVIAGGCLTVGASYEGYVTIPYAEKTPVIDGVASPGEYTGDPLIMDAQASEAWVGAVSEETVTTWHLAWDEQGLYVVATVKDSTPSYRGENANWVGIDCVEIGVNPGYTLTKKDDKGVFFSMGATSYGGVVVYRHNYDEKIVSDKVEGCATGHAAGNDSYTVEVCIPWSLIFIEADCTKTDTHLDATHLVPENNLVMDFVMATIDADESGTISAAYKFKDTDFVTGSYLIACLVGGKDTDDETVAAETEALTEPDEAATSDLVILPPVTLDTEVSTAAEGDPETDMPAPETDMVAETAAEAGNTAAGEETFSVPEVEATELSDTQAPADNENMTANTSAPQTAVPGTDVSPASSGCGSLLSATTLLILLMGLGGLVLLKRKRA